MQPLRGRKTKQPNSSAFTPKALHPAAQGRAAHPGEPATLILPMTDPPALQVLFEDNHCLVVAKPAPLLTQGVPPGIPTLESMAKAYLKERYGKKGNVYLGIPHRL